MPAAPHPKSLKINLLPREDFDDSYAGQFLKWALTYGRYIIIITQIVVLGVFFARFRLDREHVDLKESITQKQALLTSVKEVEDEVRNIQERLAQIKKLNLSQYSTMAIVNFLSEVTPTDIAYNNIHVYEGRFIIDGNGHSLRSLSALLYQLKKSNKFTEITLDDIKREPGGVVVFKVVTKYLVQTFRI